MLAVVGALSVNGGEIEFALSVFEFVDHEVEHGLEDLEALGFDHAENSKLGVLFSLEFLVVVADGLVRVVLGNCVDERGLFGCEERAAAVPEEWRGVSGISEEVFSADSVLIASFKLATFALKGRRDDLVLGEGDSLVEQVRIAQRLFFELEDTVVTDLSDSNDSEKVMKSTGHESEELAKLGVGDEWSVERCEREAVNLGEKSNALLGAVLVGRVVDCESTPRFKRTVGSIDPFVVFFRRAEVSDELGDVVFAGSDLSGAELGDFLLLVRSFPSDSSSSESAGWDLDGEFLGGVRSLSGDQEAYED